MPPQAVPQTMLSSSAVVPQTMLSHAESAQEAPHTALRPRNGPDRVRFPPDGVAPGVAQTVPQMTLSPSLVVDAPQGTSVRHAFASGCSMPPPMR